MTQAISQSYFGVGFRKVRAHQTLEVWYGCLKVATPSLSQILPAHNQTRVLKSSEIDSFVSQISSKQSECFSGKEWEEFVALLGVAKSFDKKLSTYAASELIVYHTTDLSSPVLSIEEAYFKLSLLSHTLKKPHQINLDGLFKILPNMAWTNYGPVLPEDVKHIVATYFATDRPLSVSHVDKFPYLLNAHVPYGVRVADASRVRLGAHLASGTTVMPAGYVNFNAGTLGASMVEGRVSSGVVLGEGTDVGGGASIMGTLSGGGKQVVSVGQKCLLGANAGLGISLGDGCTVAAGVYVTAGSKVYLLNAEDEPVNLEGQVVDPGKNIFKALELSGRDHLLFMQNSQTGQLVCKPNLKTIQLNPDLHTKND